MEPVDGSVLNKDHLVVVYIVCITKLVTQRIFPLKIVITLIKGMKSQS